MSAVHSISLVSIMGTLQACLPPSLEPPSAEESWTSIPGSLYLVTPHPVAFFLISLGSGEKRLQV